MSIPKKGRLYLIFFVSGFCSLVYQMVWTRLAFASFGIITPVLSVVLSVFMLGLSVGAWAGGRMIPSLVRKTGYSALIFYGVAELVIGFGAFAVPALFAAGQRCLLFAGQANSAAYLILSALVLAVSILPWCVCMGVTFPWMMAYVREEEAQNADSFSFLYAANVLGAMTGTIVTAFVLVETMGFHGTLSVAAAGNFGIAVGCALIVQKKTGTAPASVPVAAAVPVAPAPSVALADGGPIRWILFTTGFISMGMEVVWTRAFIPVLSTQVYTFAAIVFTYLGATFLGSLLYRRHLRHGLHYSIGPLLLLLGLTALLPVLAINPHLHFADLLLWNGLFHGDTRVVTDSLGLQARLSGALVLGSICPMCALLGYLTPRLIDQYAAGNPGVAGNAYGLNVVGCILGPLCASYLLLPNVSERYSLLILGLPLFGLGFFWRKTVGSWQALATAMAAGTVVVWSLFSNSDYDGWLTEHDPHTQVRRDYAATVTSRGEGFNRELLINGIGMTMLCSEVKFMVHLPMVLHTGKPGSILIICFGMGTGYRSALSWDVPTTAVELVPSVVDAFGFYHADAAAMRANPNGRIVIDDGRRYLKRTREKYDVIVIDPPPPVEAAGSSLLYSREFFELAKQHLNPNGILQIWYPGGSKVTGQAATHSLAESFPYTRCFVGWQGWGLHFLGSMEPIEPATLKALAGRMPPKAAKDLTEWMDPKVCPTVPAALKTVIAKEFLPAQFLNPNPDIQITDDQPFNEYYFLREHGLYSP